MSKVITFGEIMMRLTTPGYARFSQAAQFDINFAGGEANVAASLALLGVTAAHVTAVPPNDIGDNVISLFKKTGVDSRHIVQTGKRLGTFYVEKGVSIRASKVIYDREYSSFAMTNPDDYNWDQIFDGATWFHFTGITPAISENAAKACLTAVKAASKLGLTISADVGYRSNLWQWGKKASEVMPELVEHCDVIVCSELDAKDIFDIHHDENIHPHSFISVCKQINQRFPQIKNILNTVRGQISATHNTLSSRCWNGTGLVETETIDVAGIVDRIGGGDAFMAGYIYGKIQFNDELQAVRFGNAASALKHTVDGDFNLITVAEVEAILAGDTSGRLRR